MWRCSASGARQKVGSTPTPLTIFVIVTGTGIPNWSRASCLWVRLPPMTPDEAPERFDSAFPISAIELRFRDAYRKADEGFSVTGSTVPLKFAG